MAHCPNPDCPHRKEMGYPAEFWEVIGNYFDTNILTVQSGKASGG